MAGTSPATLALPATEFCPIVGTMKLLGNQWNMIAIRYLHDQPMKFNQLKRTMGISSKTLSRTLKHLTDEGLAQRRILDTVPISVEYRLTDRGAELSDTLVGMKSWGMRWLNSRTVPAAVKA